MKLQSDDECNTHNTYTYLLIYLLLRMYLHIILQTFIHPLHVDESLEKVCMPNFPANEP